MPVRTGVTFAFVIATALGQGAGCGKDSTPSAPNAPAPVIESRSLPRRATVVTNPLLTLSECPAVPDPIGDGGRCETRSEALLPADRAEDGALGDARRREPGVEGTGPGSARRGREKTGISGPRRSWVPARLGGSGGQSPSHRPVTSAVETWKSRPGYSPRPARFSPGFRPPCCTGLFIPVYVRQR